MQSKICMFSRVQYEEQLAQLNADIKGDARALRISNQVLHLPQLSLLGPSASLLDVCSVPFVQQCSPSLA